ncbi:MAG TPA: FKBP-type peptidyl-prolyl cis-trans isomerase [Steroidobacteraceae bacterium]|nr:FKBP-type peptidyl-prolyl cis-trans isomerase [Steroidobacteraceae bacterium]
MRKAFVFIALAVAGTHVIAAEPQSDQDKTLYSLGVLLAKNVDQFQLTPAELEMVKAGFNDGVQHKPKVEASAYMEKLNQLHGARLAAASAGEIQAGKAFQDKAAAEKGATRTASGLIFKSLKQGTGATPVATDTVKVNYQGTLTNGKVFDSSYERHEPATFPLNGVIPCWTEGLQMMKVGGKARLVCPADIAYGDRGAPPDIKPGATLVFDVELLDVQKAKNP